MDSPDLQSSAVRVLETLALSIDFVVGERSGRLVLANTIGVLFPQAIERPQIRS